VKRDSARPTRTRALSQGENNVQSNHSPTDPAGKADRPTVDQRAPASASSDGEQHDRHQQRPGRDRRFADWRSPVPRRRASRARGRMTTVAVERREESEPLALARTDPLAGYAKEINAALGECERAATQTLRWMLEAGRLLQEVKDQHLTKHGEFEAWVRAHCRVTPRMARLYRQAWRRSRELKPETISGFRRLRDLLTYCAQHDTIRTVRLGFESQEQYESYVAALRRHSGALAEPVPLIIQALNALPCHSTP